MPDTENAEQFDSIRIFEKNGETFIGKFLTKKTDPQQYDTAIKHYNTFLGSEDYLNTGTLFADENTETAKKGETLLVVANPAKIVFSLTNTGSGRASIGWKIVPLFYKDLTATGGRYFYFNVNDITLSCIGGAGINSMYEKVLAAYKDIAGE